MKKIFLSFFALTIGLLWCSTTTAQNVLLNEDFESVELDKGDGSLSYNLPEGWTKIDADSDGNNWYIFGNSSGFGGGNCATSASWGGGKALTPNNYLITPKVEGAQRVEFYANVQDATSPGALGDHFAVCASSTGTAEGDFTIIFEDTPAAVPPSGQTNRAQGTWRKYVVNLPVGTKYVAFRHYNCTNFFRINIDNVTVYDTPGTGGITPQPNMNTYITLTVVKGSEIKLDLQAIADGTPVRIMSGSLDTIISVGTAWHGYTTHKADDTTMKVYGNVTRFACSNNGAKITALDLSHNTNLTHLICNGNQITDIDVKGSEELKWLDCYGNRFSTQALDNIYCQLPDRAEEDNAVIFTLKDASDPNVATVLASTKKNATDKNWKVQYSDSKTDIPATTGTHECYPTNMASYITLTVVKDSAIRLDFAATAEGTGVRIISGNMTKNITVGPEGKGTTAYIAADNTMTIYGDIVALDCSENEANITALDPSHNTGLTQLNCFKNSIRTLDLSKNTQLTLLDCQNNQLSTLDLSKNTALMMLGCSNNQQLTSLSLSNNTSLMMLWCFNSKLSSLDVSGCTQLTDLRCFNNLLTSLNVNGCTQLTDIICYSNQLTSLDVSNNTELKTISCGNNKLTSLDVSNNTGLTSLWCFGNKLNSLDVSKNVNLTMLGCWGNNFTTAALNTIYCELPDRTGQSQSGLILPLHESSSAAEQSIVKATNKKNATNKNWKVQTYKDNNKHTDINTTGTDDCNSVDIAEATAEQQLTLYPNPTADVLYLSATARTIHIYNMYGTEVVQAADTDHINVSHLPTGVYTVKADGTVTKMVKK